MKKKKFLYSICNTILYAKVKKIERKDEKYNKKKYDVDGDD